MLWTLGVAGRFRISLGPERRIISNKVVSFALMKQMYVTGVISMLSGLTSLIDSCF